jgi:hypothetical protein
MATVLDKAIRPSSVGLLTCEIDGASPCSCGHKLIPAGVGGIVFSPDQALDLAQSLRAHGNDNKAIRELMERAEDALNVKDRQRKAEK